MPNHYNVLMPRPYTAKDGAEKTAFTKIGVAFPMKDRDGFSISLECLPLPSLSKDGRLECKLLLMPPLDNEQQAEPQASKAAKAKAAVDSDNIPF